MKRTFLSAVFCLLTAGTVLQAAGSDPLSSVRDALARSGFLSYRAERKQSKVNKDFTYFMHGLIGNARLESKQVIFNADRLLFVYYIKGRALNFTHPFEIYAEGNVVVTPGKGYDKGPQVFLMADALYYDGRTLQGLAVNTRIRAKGLAERGREDLPDKLGFLARELRFKGKLEKLKDLEDKPKVRFHYFKGKDISVSPCDLSAPHWGLKCESIEAAHEKDAPGSYVLSTRGQYLSVANRRVLPMPPISVSTRFFSSLPLRRIQVVSSKKFGYGVRTTWDLVRSFGLERQVAKIRRKTGMPLEVDGEVDALSKRGVGLGTNIRFGLAPRKWTKDGSFKNLTQDLRLYGIHDSGDDRHEDSLYSGYAGNDWRRDKRYRLRYFGRAKLPVIGSLNAEVAMWRDRNFYKEFFERELYGGRTPETYFQWRKEFYDTMVASVLYRPRVNKFQDYAEKLPEGKINLLPYNLSGHGLGPTVRAEMRAGKLAFKPDKLYPGSGSFDTERYHGESGIAIPLGLGRYIRFRPFYEVAATHYSQKWQGAHGADRLVQTGGVSASTQFWRNYRLKTPLFDTGVLKHVVAPQVSYHNAFFSNQDHGQFYQFDEIDALDKLEYLEMSLATYLLARSVKGDIGPNPTVERLLELRARVRYFPEASRDNRHGGLATGSPDNFSNVFLDLYTDALLKNVTLGVESQIDTAEGRGFVVVNPYASFRLNPHLRLSVGQLFMKSDSALSLEKSNHLWGNLTWQISPLYTVMAHGRYDFSGNGRRKSMGEQRISVARTFHCFTLLAGVEVDNGDDEVKYMIHIYPAGFRSFAGL